MKELINNVIFDFGGTLVEMVPSREDICLKVLEELGHGKDELDKLKQHINGAYSHADFYYKDCPTSVGIEDKIQYYSSYNYQLVLYLGIESMYEKFNDVLQSRMRYKRWIIFRDVVPVIKRLKENGKKIFILSNWDNSLERICKDNGIINAQLFDYDKIYTSWKMEVGKPNKEFYLTFINATRLDVEKSIYIGDNYYTDVVASRKCGIKSILIDREKKCCKVDCIKIDNLYELIDIL